MSYLGQGLGLGREERFTATATDGQTTVTVGDDGRSISYTPNYVDVYLNGIKMVNGQDITVSSGTSVVFTYALTVGDVVDVVAPGYFQPADTVSRSLGGTFLGAVNLPSGGLNVGSGQLQVDSSGRVRMGSQPCFTAGIVDGGGLASNFSSGQVVPFGNVITNVGGHYNSSTNRFTAPIAGVYEFYSQCSFGNTSLANLWVAIRLRKNGSIVTPYALGGVANTGNNSYDCVTHLVYLSLAAGDYVDVYAEHNTFNGNLSYGEFSGRLLG